MSTTHQTHGWRIEARDPLVFGDGTRQPALMPVHRAWMPPQPTIAGFVRARFWDEENRDRERQARSLLDGVSLRGPWLLEHHGLSANQSTRLWIPAPGDVRWYRDGNRKVLTKPAHPMSLAGGEGTYISATGGAPPPRVVHVADKIGDGVKTQELRFPLWRLEHAVAWSLGESPSIEELVEFDRNRWPLEREHRVHVGLDDLRGTAEPEALFTSSGIRVREDCAIAVDVSATGGLGSARPGTGTLGGRSRPSRVHVEGAPHWPAFSSVEKKYDRRHRELLEHGKANGRRVLLRLQLVTPGCFGGWIPPREGPLADLTLEAALVPAPTVESGWDMVHRRPRSVRRLVSPGAIYWYSSTDPTQLLDRCRKLWDQPLPSGPGHDDDSTRAHPERDGYGQVIPGLQLEE